MHCLDLLYIILYINLNLIYQIYKTFLLKNKNIIVTFKFQKYIENISLIILIFFGIKKNVKKYFLNKFVKYSHIYTINSLL